MSHIFNRHDQTLKRRTLRRTSPAAERRLWSRLRRNTCGAKFCRQTSVRSYVVDFYCRELHLVIEVDGPTHQNEQAARDDACRQAAIESLGVRFLRFTNSQVYNHLPDVMETIEGAVKELQSKAAAAGRENPFCPPGIFPSERGRIRGTEGTDPKTEADEPGNPPRSGSS